MATLSPKVFISAPKLEQDSWDFARQLYAQKIEVDHIVGISRGGLQFALYVQEALGHLQNRELAFSTVEAKSYSGIGLAGDVELRHVDTLGTKILAGERILLLDDIFDRGRTLAKIHEVLQHQLAKQHCEISIGVLYYKPENRQVELEPNHYLRIYPKEAWLVFPHELRGLSEDELKEKGFNFSLS